MAQKPFVNDASWDCALVDWGVSVIVTVPARPALEVGEERAPPFPTSQ